MSSQNESEAFLEFGNLVRSCRQVTGLTIEAFSGLLDVTPANLRAIEAGALSPNALFLEKFEELMISCGELDPGA